MLFLALVFKLNSCKEPTGEQEGIYARKNCSFFVSPRPIRERVHKLQNHHEIHRTVGLVNRSMPDLT